MLYFFLFPMYLTSTTPPSLCLSFFSFCFCVFYHSVTIISTNIYLTIVSAASYSYYTVNWTTIYQSLAAFIWSFEPDRRTRLTRDHNHYQSHHRCLLFASRNLVEACGVERFKELLTLLKP